MNAPRITTECPGCKPLLDLQQAIIDALVEQAKKLTERLEKVEREGKRQAAPFRRKRQSDPKKPGRKSGEEHGKHHRLSDPEPIDETCHVLLPAGCPNRGSGELRRIETRTQYQSDIPQAVIHRQFHH